MVKRGTQIGDPNFGSDLYKIITCGNTTSTAARIRTEIDRVMELYYPELQLNNIDVEFAGTSIYVYVNYSITRSNLNADVTLEFIEGETSSDNY